MSVKTAMVLAAGLGTRMRPLTDAVPKPLVPLLGKPLLDHVLDRLASAGIEQAIVNVHYMADQIENHLRDRSAPEILISDERNVLLETGGGVALALPKLGEEAFFIHNSDSVWVESAAPCLEQMGRAWNPDIMDTLLLLAPINGTLGYDGNGDFDMDANSVVRRPEPSEQVPFVFTGVSIAHPRLFENCPQGKFSLNVLWDKAIAAGRVHGMRLEGTWMHVGTPEDVREAEERLRHEQG